VIVFDPWWNPAVENQAIDRAHRIGQDKKVMVYKMIVKDSIEEKVLELQEKKKCIATDLITSDIEFYKNLKREDLLELLA
jgi:SNF2 family DNA or RNA helicase